MFADEDIKPQNFWTSSKSHVATTNLCMHFVVIALVGLTKVSILKYKCTLINRMWQHDFMTKQIVFSSIFSSENTGRVAKQAGYPGSLTHMVKSSASVEQISGLQISGVGKPFLCIW
jgi:hypothetical protein